MTGPPARIIDPREMNRTDGEVGVEMVNAAAITIIILGNTSIGTAVVLETSIEIEDAGTRDLGQGRGADNGKDEIAIERNPSIVERGATHLDGLVTTTTLLATKVATDEVKNSVTDLDKVSIAKA